MKKVTVKPKSSKAKNCLANTMDGNPVCVVEKETGFCYKPASYRGPAKGVRYGIHQLVNYPETCDPYGSFLYMK